MQNIIDEKCPDCGTHMRPAGSYRTKDSLYQRYSCPKCLKKITDKEPYATIDDDGRGNLRISCTQCGCVWMPAIAPGGKWYRNAFQCPECSLRRRSYKS